MPASAAAAAPARRRPAPAGLPPGQQHKADNMGSNSSSVSTSVSLGIKCMFSLSCSLFMIISASLYLAQPTQSVRSEDSQARTNALNRLEANPSAQLRSPVHFDQGFPIIGDESIMSPKAHGTCVSAVQTDLRWDCDRKVADNICCFNRHYAGKVCA